MRAAHDGDPLCDGPGTPISLKQNLREASRTPAAATASVVLGSLSAQLSSTLAKTLFPVYGPLGTSALRISLEAGIFLLVTRPRVRHLEFRRVTAALVMGGLMATVILLNYAAISRLPLGTAVTLQLLGPIGVSLFFAQSMKNVGWVAVLVIGVALVVGLPKPSSLIGVVFALGSALAVAGYLLVATRIMIEPSDIRLLGIALGVGALITSPVAISAIAKTPHVGSLAPLAGVGLLGLVPVWTEVRAVRYISVRSVSVLICCDPIFACLLGWIFLKQVLSPRDLVGIGLVAFSASRTVRGPLAPTQ
jgi:inner membrane transporter RhtA